MAGGRRLTIGLRLLHGYLTLVLLRKTCPFPMREGI